MAGAALVALLAAGPFHATHGAAPCPDLGARVLVVDDYATMRRILENLLKQIGYSRIDAAEDGNQALARLRGGGYGLIISDWNMQPVTGLQLLREVRADPALRTIPFIMITAESKKENVMAAREAGASNYLVKPFNADTLKRKIEETCSPR